MNFDFFSKIFYTLIPKVQAFDVGVGIPGAADKKYTGYCDYVRDIYTFALNAGFALATLMVIFAGYKYLTSQGNTTAINDAKDIIIGSIIGFIILLLVKQITIILGVGSCDIK